MKEKINLTKSNVIDARCAFCDNKLTESKLDIFTSVDEINKAVANRELLEIAGKKYCPVCYTETELNDEENRSDEEIEIRPEAS